MICKVCKKEKLGSKSLGICKDCILNRWKEAKILAEKVHSNSRLEFGLVEKVPKEYLECKICANLCKIGEGESGFCGLRKVENNKIVSFVDNKKILADYYYDILPTNCVASPFCKSESGKYNLAIFCGACNFNCLFCQNWSFKYNTRELSPILTQNEILGAINENVYCVCFFGGDPGPQLPFIIEFCRKARKNLRFCLETNGIENPKLLKKFAEICFESNGIIKFDLKFFNENLSLALSGVSNKQTYKNFEMLAKMNSSQIVASTLLIPGYVDENEVYNIAKFIASLDDDIPYVLLAFYPCFKFNDLPTTSLKQANSCLKVAKKTGLRRVEIGNIHLLR